jgi:hypothetical protein
VHICKKWDEVFERYDRKLQAKYYKTTILQTTFILASPRKMDARISKTCSRMQKSAVSKLMVNKIDLDLMLVVKKK